MASSGVTHTIESLFGPPSDLIYIADFIKTATAQLEDLGLSRGERNANLNMDIASECSVDDIKRVLERMLDEPLLSTHMVKDHEQMINLLYSNFAKNKKVGRKAHLSAPDLLAPEVVEMQKELDGVRLKSWRLNTESVMFVRPPRNSDYNSIDRIKPAQPGGAIKGASPEAVITVSIFNKVPWGPSYVSRLCQHAYLSSQSLQSIHMMLPCIFNASASAEASSAGNPAGMKPGCTICIENVLYSDTPEYSNQVLRHLSTASKAPAKPTVSQRTMSETIFSSLSLRINLPYPVLHAGNCEHFMVVEQIRLWHSSDPTSGYPQILQVTPPLPSLCYACHKVPATISIVGDERLGESPSLLCGPCWRAMGSFSDDVVVTPLPLS